MTTNKDISPGHRFLLAGISWLKRMLIDPDMTARERLQILEHLNGLTEKIDPTTMAVIEPAGDLDNQFITDAIRNETDLLETDEIFNHLLQLNPSLGRAIQIHTGAKATA